MFDFQKQDNSKKERTTSDEEIGSFIAWMFYGLFLLAAIGIFFTSTSNSVSCWKFGS